MKEGERIGQKNRYEGPTDMDNGVGIDCGSGGRVRQREAKEGEIGTTVTA